MSTYFGLDFGNSSIKLVKASMVTGKSYKVSGVGLVQNPAGSVDFLNEKVRNKIAPVVKKLVNNVGIEDKRAVISIPESKVYSKVLKIPTMSESELASAIKWEAEQFIPVPIDEVEIDYQVVKNADETIDGQSLVYIVGAPKKMLQAMVDFVLSVGIEPIAVESEMVAVSRSMMYGLDISKSMMLVHLGALSTVMGIVSEEKLIFAHDLDAGGVAMTRAISESLHLPLMQAEEYKRTYGLDKIQLEGKIRQSLLLVMELIVNEMRKAIEHIAIENRTKIEKIIISGGGAYLPELGSYFGEQFEGMEILIGDPFTYAKAGKGIQLPKERAAYVVASGLALREE